MPLCAVGIAGADCVPFPSQEVPKRGKRARRSAPPAPTPAAFNQAQAAVEDGLGDKTGANMQCRVGVRLMVNEAGQGRVGVRFVVPQLWFDRFDDINSAVWRYPDIRVPNKEPPVPAFSFFSGLPASGDTEAGAADSAALANDKHAGSAAESTPIDSAHAGRAANSAPANSAHVGPSGGAAPAEDAEAGGSATGVGDGLVSQALAEKRAKPSVIRVITALPVFTAYKVRIAACSSITSE